MRTPEKPKLPSAALENESPRWNSPLEWWFVQGVLWGSELSRRFFFTSLFRQRLGPGKGDGYSVLLSMLEDGGTASSSLHLVEPGVVDHLTELIEREGSSALDPHLRVALLRLLREEGPPDPIRRTEVNARVERDRLKIDWSGFLLSQAKGHLKLGFDDPFSGDVCRLILRPTVPHLPIRFPSSVRRALGIMGYHCYPRLRVSGRIANHTVKGLCWLDHQWGRVDWLLQKGAAGTRILGWDWFGINLDDGTDLVVMCHRDMAANQEIARHATLRHSSGRSITTDCFDIRSGKDWISPRTRATYPLQWRFLFPDHELEISVRAKVRDQELPLLGPARCLWEGAAEVDASRQGRDVRGRARMELYGYGFIFDFNRHMEAFSKRIDARLEGFLPPELDSAVTAAPSENRPTGWDWPFAPADYRRILSAPTWDLLARGGKRWRPMFGMLLLQALGCDAEPYEELMAVFSELPHSGSLMIDDIQDCSILRRREPCIHLKYGLDLTINAANTLYFLPFVLIERHPRLRAAQKLEMYRIITRAYIQAHFGQGFDLCLTRDIQGGAWRTLMGDGMEHKILTAYALKTGAVLASLAEIAALIAAAPPGLRRACRTFARHLGIAFQMVDDVLNLHPSPHWTKEPGEDLRQGKMTYLLLRTLRSLPLPDRRRLQHILSRSRLRSSEEGLSEALALIQRSGMIERCREDAERMVDDPWKRLEKLLDPSEPRLMLSVFCRELLHRGTPPEGH